MAFVQIQGFPKLPDLQCIFYILPFFVGIRGFFSNKCHFLMVAQPLINQWPHKNTVILHHENNKYSSL